MFVFALPCVDARTIQANSRDAKSKLCNERAALCFSSKQHREKQPLALWWFLDRR